MTLPLLLALASTGAPALAQPDGSAQRPTLDASQIRAMRAVIDDQLAAFQRDDAAAAWKHVAPGAASQVWHRRRVSAHGSRGVPARLRARAV